MASFYIDLFEVEPIDMNWLDESQVALEVTPS